MRVIKSEIFFVVLFIINVVIPTFNNFELTFATWSISALLTIQFRYSVGILRLVFIKLIIVFIAFVSTLYYDYSDYKIIRDFTYLFKPILGLLIGYQLLKRIKTVNPFLMIVYGSLVLAIIHFIILFVSFFVFNISSVNNIRTYGGYFSDFEVYGLVILLFSNKLNVELSKKRKLYFISIIGLSVLVYFARTNFIQLAILCFSLLGYFKLTLKSFRILSVFSAVILLSYAAIYHSNPRRNSKGLESFLYKVKIAPIEPFKTKINQNDWKEFNDNYRSFENIITVRQVAYEGPRAIWFGKGLGSFIDIGREMWTNDGEYIRYVPALHNSYMTILLKSGLTGVFLMFIFLFYLQKKNKSNQIDVQNLNNLLFGTAVFLILSNWVFMGLYFKVDNKAIIIGYLIAYREEIQKKLV